MPQLVSHEPPPPDYYARNLGCLLDEVTSRCGDLLGAVELEFLHAYRSASIPAQRLFARLLSRKGPWLLVETLDYPEVGPAHRALAELYDHGLVARTPQAPADVLLGLLTRARLTALYPGVRGRTKPEWISACVARYPDLAIRRRIADVFPWVAVRARSAFDVCQLLFFGGDRQDLSAFVVQDLGIQRYENYVLSRETQPFSGRRALDRYLRCRQAAVWARRVDELPALAARARHALGSPVESRPEQRLRDKTLNRLGRWHERRGELHEALECYARGTSHPARERQARILGKLGDDAALESLLARMRADPWTSEEQDFVQRSRGGRRRAFGPVERSHGAALTSCVAAQSWCRLRGPTPASIERHALHLLTHNGGRGWHLENALPLALAGLAFWEEMFAPVEGAFSHAFQLGPRDLFWPDFARARQELLQARLRALEAPGALERSLRATFEAKRGLANQLVRWGAVSQELLDSLLVNVPHAVLHRLAAHTIFNLPRARTGFPDLLVIYGPGAWELVEVKGPTDQLQPAQRVWLSTLDALGAPARVLRFRAAC